MQSCKRYKNLIKKYLSDEITKNELSILKQHLNECPLCNELLELNDQLMKNTNYNPSETLSSSDFENMRQKVFNSLSKNNTKTFSFKEFIFSKFYNPTIRFSPGLAFALIIIVFLTGFYINKNLTKSSVDYTNCQLADIKKVALQNHTLNDVEDSPYLFTDVRIQRTDLGEIELDFNVTRTVRYVADQNDPLVKEVIAQALINQTNDGYRMVALDISENVIDPKIKEALIFTALYDENSAVRTKALEILGELKLDQKLQDAFIKILNNESSVAMKLMTLDILAKNNISSNALLPILKERFEYDQNPSVKLKAANYIHSLDRR